MTASPPPRLIFFGTPLFAAPFLKALVEADLAPLAVVSQPDRPRGRGRKLAPSEVKKAAEKLDLPVIQPERAGDPEFIQWLVDQRADLLVVVAFGQLLPAEVLAAARLGAINLHPSLLPRWRGPAPIPRAIMAGDAETGVCLMWLDEGMDTGDVIRCRPEPIGPDDTAGDLESRLAHLGATLMVETITDVLAGRAEGTPQDDSAATYAAALDPAEAEMDWSRPADELDRLIRGLDPRPGAWTSLGGDRLKIFRSKPTQARPDGPPGTVIGAEKNGLLVATGRGVLRLGQVQPPGKKNMDAAAWWRGRRLPVGTRLGT
jgi:methionyl-tRNA formyltransferase